MVSHCCVFFKLLGFLKEPGTAGLPTHQNQNHHHQQHHQVPSSLPTSSRSHTPARNNNLYTARSSNSNTNSVTNRNSLPRRKNSSSSSAVDVEAMIQEINKAEEMQNNMKAKTTSSHPAERASRNFANARLQQQGKADKERNCDVSWIYAECMEPQTEV